MSSSSPDEGRHEAPDLHSTRIAAVPVAAPMGKSKGKGKREWVDYSSEMRINENPLLRGVFVALGLFTLGLGILGVVLPGWPTTIWVIISTYFFMRSSPRLYNLVMNHRIFGPLIRDYRSGKGIPRRAKILAVSMIILFGGTSALFIIPILWVRLAVLLLVVAGVAYLLHLPTSDALPQGN